MPPQLKVARVSVEMPLRRPAVGSDCSATLRLAADCYKIVNSADTLSPSPKDEGMHELTIALVGLASFLLASDPHIARKAARAYGTTPPAPVILLMRVLAGGMALLSAALLLLRLSLLF